MASISSFGVYLERIRAVLQEKGASHLLARLTATMKAPCKSGMLVGAFVLVLLLRDTWARSWRDVDNTINIARG